MSYMQIQTFNFGVLSTNCYVVNCPITQESIIIDPGFDHDSEVQQIIGFVDGKDLRVKLIVNTHGHSDHVQGNNILKKKFDVPVCIHIYDAPFLGDLDKSISSVGMFLEDDEIIRFGEMALKVMHTPGHTRGSIALVGEGIVFTGDTLFAGGIGRTDFPESSSCDMKLSLKRLLSLPDNYVVYPGHGPSSTIDNEKRLNPFLNCL